jgi:hypothetical protein
MLEREEGLSAEEKFEAELLYEREKKGITVRDDDLYSENPHLRGPMMSDRFPRQQPVVPFYIGENGLPNGAFGLPKLQQPSPMPRSVQRVDGFAPGNGIYPSWNTPPLGMVRPLVPSPTINNNIRIDKEITLPLVTLPGQARTLTPGQEVLRVRTQNGTYLRTQDGSLLDARGTPYAGPVDEVIELD